MKIPYVSPSRLKTADACEFKYFLNYVWRWDDELFTYTFCSEFGSAVHYTLEEYAESQGTADYKAIYHKHIMDLKPFVDDMNKAPSKARGSFFVEKDCENCPFFGVEDGTCGMMPFVVDDVVAFYNIDEFEGCPKRLYGDGLAMVEQAIERYGKYFDTGIKSKDNPNGKVIGVEAPTRKEADPEGPHITWGVGEDDEPINMNGFIDLVVEYDEETLLVVDYKTGYSVPEYEKFLQDLQPRMYSYAAKHMYPQYKYHWVQFDYFRSSAPLEHAFTDEDDEQTRQYVTALYNQIKSARSIKRRGEDWYCKHLCNRPFCDQKWRELLDGLDGSNPNPKER